ncbi:hypothetical protein EX30DRAFT_339682 [Ascodesmis nigricans]|uniref:Auxin efflux carrier n=1 Tax=Ascodesmis nigricans TaxID=341454 RepID=A0A4S2MZZ5_9PEZI|nr:hypothetical protein EX30DRAFT_339682 [Ascodesmis nigricans]
MNGSDSGSALAISFLGAFQASVSVLLTLSYGVLAARLKMLSPSSAEDISRLCVNLFLPALLITNVGSNLTLDNITIYVPVFIWSIVYAIVSAIIGKILTKVFKLPSWVTPAITFNNTTSLPLLLTQALATTGILDTILTGGESASDAVDRANSFFLINSMISNAATLALGPKLLDKNEGGDDDETEAEDSDENNDNQQDQEETNENSPLLPKPITHAAERVHDTASDWFHRLPYPIQVFLRKTGKILNPTVVGAIIAIIIGLCPPIQHALFANMDEGGIFRSWLTSSLKNIGELFTALQMFVVGSKLNSSLQTKEGSVGSKKALVVIFIVRFIFWGAVSLPVVYLLAAKTELLDADPILWFAMCMMPTGPPAMILSALTDVAGIGRKGKMQVARLLTYMYAITPLIFVIVVLALKACEKALQVRGEK